MHQPTAARHTAVTIARYFDQVVDQLQQAGVAVATLSIDLSTTAPMRGQLMTAPGLVLRWREDLGWSTGARSTGPAAHPAQVALLLGTG